MIDINEGRTNSYLIPGLIALAVAGTFFFIGTGYAPSIIPGLISVIVAVLIFAASTGLQIDTEKMRYRKYGKIGGYNLGEWSSYDKIESAKLVKDHEDLRSEDRAWVASSSRGGTSMSTVVLTYDVQLVDYEGVETTIFEFNEYRFAKKALKQIHEQMQIPVRNLVAEQMSSERRM